MKYLSVCSGIEAASVAWHSLGWKPLAFSEIEPFPRKVLAHHYPNVPLHGDFTILRDQDWIRDADVLVGGTPCQAFSVAGLRQSLNDDRGNLTLEFVRLADAIDDLRPAGCGTIIVWENVPGVLSVSDNAFGCFLAALVGNDTPLKPTGGKWTNAGMVVGPRRKAVWRVLDAQYFGVAQRRRRVFVVASARDGFDPAEVLFEREGVRRHHPPSRQTGQEPSATIAARFGISRNNHEEVVTHVEDVAPTLTKEGTGVSRPGFQEDGWYVAQYTEEVADTLSVGANQTIGQQSPSVVAEIVGSLCARTGQSIGVQDAECGHLMPITFGAQMSHPQTDVDMVQTLGAKNPMAVAHTVGTLTRASSAGGTITQQDIQAGHIVAQPIAIHPHVVGRSENAGPQGKEYLLDGSAYTMDSRGVAQAVAQPMTQYGDLAGTLSARHDSSPCADRGQNMVAQPIGVDCFNGSITGDVACTMGTSGSSVNSSGPTLMQSMAVRRLTPRECERLQGFPDDYTLLPGKPADGPRYKALGNSMAVPVMHWIGKRIDLFLK